MHTYVEAPLAFLRHLLRDLKTQQLIKQSVLDDDQSKEAIWGHRGTGEFLFLMELKEMEKLDNHLFKIACDKLGDILGGVDNIVSFPL